MKTFLLPLFVLFAFVSSAQIVNIPDVEFKAALLSHDPVIDVNHDGEIQESEALNTLNLYVDQKGIFDLTGVQAFANLDTLQAWGNFLTTADVSGMAHLRWFNVSFNDITSVNVSNCPAMEILRAEYNNLTTIDLSGVPNLIELIIGVNMITSLDLTGLNSLNYFVCPQNNLTSLTLVDLPSLDNVQCHINNLTSLNINNCPYLTYLACYQNQLTSIDMSGTNFLGYLNCSENPLLTTINFKNGSVGYATLLATNDNALHYICTDDDPAEINYYQNLFAASPNISINSYCTVPPGGGFNTISGNSRVDANSNGCDATDPLRQQLKLALYNGTETIYTQTTNAGNYYFYPSAGNFTITPQLTDNYYTVNPLTQSVNFVLDGGLSSTADFCFVPNGNHNDLEIVLLPITPARPGFAASYTLLYRNAGTTTLSGNVTLNFNAADQSFVFADPAATTQSAGSLTWAYSNLQPLESRSVIVTLNLLPPPATNAGDLLNFTAIIDPVVSDEVQPNNYFGLKQLVTGSIDPNDKTCLEGKFIDITKAGEYVHYIIRFQNTGTDTAFNVVIKDILSDKYDWNSIQMTSASHPCFLKQSGGNKLEFFFENILMPAQSVNDAASHGYVSFKIKPANTVVINDSLINNASIYFDFNLPVVTEDAVTIFIDPGTVAVSMEYFNGRKENTKNILTWKSTCSNQDVRFEVERSNDSRNFKPIGNITASNSRCQQPFDFTDNNPVNGINYYRIKTIGADGKITYSDIVTLLNKNVGFEIISLAPNPVTDKASFLNIVSAQSQQINTRIIDVMGRSVYNKSQSLAAGSTQIELNLPNLSRGIYTIIINSTEGEVKKLRFVKE
ncbi:MAG: T9SS type A sorting domain-containing protein [Ferruginibacter sp.]